MSGHPWPVIRRPLGLPGSSHFYKTTRLAGCILNWMKLNPCFSLSFDGRCEEAFRFYERCFSAKIPFLLAWKDSPMAKEVPPEWGDKVFHATLVVGTATFTGSDARPGTYQSP